jgi:hypothetical protein
MAGAALAGPVYCSFTYPDANGLKSGITNMRTLTVQGYTATVYPPFVAGHVLKETEASQLNQTWTEAIRNNTASKIKALQASDDFTALDEVAQKAAVEALVQAYAADFEFGVAGRGGPRVAPVDPVEKLAWTLAETFVRAEMVKALAAYKAAHPDYKKSLTKKEVDENVDEYLAQEGIKEQYLAEAKAILAKPVVSGGFNFGPKIAPAETAPEPAPEPVPESNGRKGKHKEAA